MKGFYIEITNNLLESKHVKSMGSAVWEYMWLIDKMTSVSEDGVGKVLGGKPIKREEIREDIGKALKNISQNLQKLEDGGYINMKRTSFGNIITVNKAKKRYNQNVTSRSNYKVTSEKSDDTKRLHQSTPKGNIMKLRKGVEHSRQDSIDKTVRQDNTTPPNPLKGEGAKDLVNYFFVLKGWNDKPKDFYSKHKIIYARFMKPASQIMELCDKDFAYAKDRVERVFHWAESRELDWGLETVIKKFLDIDKLTEKEKKPTWKGMPMYKRGGKWWVITDNGEHKQFTNKLSEIVYV